MSCEASTLDKLKNNTLANENDKALVIGNWVHSALESDEAHEKFKKQHPEAISSKGKTKGQLKSDYKIADLIIDRVRNDDFFKFIYQGQRESIVTGELFGIQWKGKIDCLDVEKGRFYDFKTCKDLLGMIWSPRHGGRVLWTIAYGYVLQMSIYKHLLEQKYHKNFDPYIIACSKTDPVGLKVIDLSEEYGRFQLEDEYVENNIKHVLAVEHGEIAPTMCDKCDWCREHQRGEQVTTLDELMREAG